MRFYFAFFLLQINACLYLAEDRESANHLVRCLLWALFRVTYTCLEIELWLLCDFFAHILRFLNETGHFVLHLTLLVLWLLLLLHTGVGEQAKQNELITVETIKSSICFNACGKYEEWFVFCVELEVKITAHKVDRAVLSNVSLNLTAVLEQLLMDLRRAACNYKIVFISILVGR